MHYAHSITETSPGHAALYTGRVPRANGIYSNDLPGPDDEDLAIVKDTASRLIAATGETEHAGASLQTACGHRRSPMGCVRPAAGDDHRLVAERSRRALRWRPQTGCRRVVRLPPRRFRYVDRRGFAFSRLGARADRSRRDHRAARDLVAARSRVPSGARRDFRTTLQARATMPAWAASSRTISRAPANRARPGEWRPETDALLLELGLQAVDHRRPGEPMLLAISLSAHDYVAHVFGPDSWEEWTSSCGSMRSSRLSFAVSTSAWDPTAGRCS
jgi:hypothetical protein